MILMNKKNGNSWKSKTGKKGCDLMPKILNEELVDKKPEDYNEEEEQIGCSAHGSGMDCIRSHCKNVFGPQDPTSSGVVVEIYCEPEEWTRPMYWHEFFRAVEIAEQIEEDLNDLLKQAEYGT
jgi:hypothetical protein